MPFSQIKKLTFFQQFLATSQPPNEEEAEDPFHTEEPTDTHTQAIPNGAVIGAPRDLEILEYTSTSVKFAWMPPALTPHSLKIKNFLISYVDKPKQFRDTNGSLITYSKSVTMTIKVPARGDPTIKIMWLVTGLNPYTEYSFNISALMSNDVQGASIHKKIRTKPGKPHKVDQPVVIDIYTDNTVELKLGNASEKNGPILKYWLVVVPIGFDSGRAAKALSVNDDQQHSIANYEARERDIANLVKYSLYNDTYSNESAYIAAEFEAQYWPSRFILGDGNKYGRFLNRKLSRGFDYKAYIVAFSNENQGVHSSSNSGSSTTIQSNKQSNRASSSSFNQSPNMLGLSDLSPQSSGYIDSDLFSYSMNSRIFNTRYVEGGPNAVPHGGSSRVVSGSYYNVLWVAGAIAALIFVFVLIILISMNVMQSNKKKQLKLITNGGNNSMVMTMNSRSSGNSKYFLK
jgi:hypothetical protein